MTRTCRYVNGEAVWDPPFTEEEEAEHRRRFDEMVESGTPPQIAGTDSIFNEGRVNGNQFEDAPWLGDMFRQEAAQAGVDVKGKTYLHGLARYPGDPEAWVADRHDVQTVVEQRGWGSKGAVKVKAQEPISAPSETAIAADIVDDKVLEVLEAVPAADRRGINTEDLREQVTNKLKPHWAKKGE